MPKSSYLNMDLKARINWQIDFTKQIQRAVAPLKYNKITMNTLTSDSEEEAHKLRRLDPFLRKLLRGSSLRSACFLHE